MAVVYRMWSNADELLYVGYSKSALRRLADHLANKEWIAEVACLTLEYFETEQEARDAELLAIQNELPRYNKAGKVSLLFADPASLMERLNDRERVLFGAILYGLGSMRSSALHLAVDHECELRQTMRSLGKWLHDQETPLELIAQQHAAMRAQRMIGLGIGYKVAESELPPSDEIRDGIRHVNRYKLALVEEAEPDAS